MFLNFKKVLYPFLFGVFMLFLKAANTSLLIFGFFLFQIDLHAETLKFPRNFKWGVATAAHQIEGQNFHSDHYQWEISKPARVISQRLVSNPEATEILKNSTGAFANKPISCPMIKRSADPENGTENMFREHTQLFDLSLSDIFLNELGENTYICEYSGKAVDHWNRVQEDVQLMKKLNVQWYRFSVEWAKIEPQKGRFNAVAIQHYIKELKALKKAGIEPHVTLFHFTMPQWLRDEGGWESDQSPMYFQRFAEKVFRSFAGSNLKIPVWYTFNEPMVHVSAGYLAGVLPPGEKNPLKIPGVLKHILEAHARSYQSLHKLALDKKFFQPKIQVGVAHHLRIFDPSAGLFFAEAYLARQIASLLDYAWNWMFIDALETGVLRFDADLLKHLNLPGINIFSSFHFVIENLKASQDFLGLNYYSRDRIQVRFDQPLNPVALLVDPEAIAQNRITDMNWEIYPEGFYRILSSLHRRVQTVGARTLPIIISENGIADADDNRRIAFLKDHLKFMKKAMNEGVPVIGYCYWSLMDNFEWNSGYYPQFGLYRIDFANRRKRIARPSAAFYSELAKTGQFSD
jgi:beta-glucosidase